MVKYSEAITTGVNKDGHALFPIMPYKTYREADSMDIVAVIAYLHYLEANCSESR